jgi:hypothetical protein
MEEWKHVMGLRGSWVWFLEDIISNDSLFTTGDEGKMAGMEQYSHGHLGLMTTLSEFRCKNRGDVGV